MFELLPCDVGLIKKRITRENENNTLKRETREGLKGVNNKQRRTTEKMRKKERRRKKE